MYIRAGIAPITTITAATQPKLWLSLAAPAVIALGLAVPAVTVEFAAAETLAWLVLAGLTRRLDISVGVAEACADVASLDISAEACADVSEDDEGAGVVSGGEVTKVVIGDFDMVDVIVLP